MVKGQQLERLPLGVFGKKGVLRNFTKFTGKHPCRSLFINKVAGLRHSILFLNHRKTYRLMLPANFPSLLELLSNQLPPTATL